MTESDEEQFALEDESMDEVHDVDGESVESVDGEASPTKQYGPTGSRRRKHRSDGEDGSDSDSDQSELFNGASSSSDSSSDDDGTHQQRIPSSDNAGRDRRRRAGHSYDRDDNDDGDDEPPEIPGSPLRTDTPETGHASPASGGGRMNRLSDVDISNCGEVARSHKQQQQTRNADIFTISDNSDNDADNDADNDDIDDDDDYETKETEAPRAMEFHSSSSSSDSGDGEDEESNQEETRSHIPQHPQHHHARQDRPKTAARDLEPYRELVSSAYFEQLVQDAPSPHKTKLSHTTNMTETRSQTRTSANPVETGKASTAKYKMRVPHEIEELFQFVDAFTPDSVDIPIRLQPFIPEYVPAIGVPFDGIQIPRPDGKTDPAGVAFVRESCAHSNAAELELLLSSAAKNKQRRRQTESVDRVHSIEDALHRPREIDQWIASVAKVQASKPMPQVLYKKPMPSLTSLMELWPEAFEVYLSTQRPDPGTLALSQLDVSLSELVRIVCGVVDIPVYHGLEIHSLHLLFALYHEVVLYEKEMQPPNR